MTTDEITCVADIPRVNAARSGGSVGLECEGRVLTYAELWRRAEQTAGLLAEAKVKPGDRIAWLGRAHEAFFELLFGAALANVCLAPINSRLAVPEIAFILDDTGASVFFVTASFVETARAAMAEVAGPIRLIVIGEDAGAAESFEALRDRAPIPLATSHEPKADLLQLYTSGTTGLPKGVRLTNANYSCFLKLCTQVDGFDYRAEDTVLMLMPLFHVAGINVSFAGLAAGARLIVLPEFSPGQVLELVGRERVSQLFLVPAMINMCLQAPEIEGADLSSLRSVAYGASPISEAVLAEAKSRFACGFVQFYGMTETAGVGTFLTPRQHEGKLLRSCGKPWPEVELKILRKSGVEAEVGEIGEISIRGDVVMAGYWNRPEATAKAISRDGWLGTGDAGFKDGEGFVFIHDRVKDLIVSGGENIYPAEVENAILGCPGVLDAAVIGVPDARWGEAVKAIVVRDPGVPLLAVDVMVWARSRIAGYKVPKSIEFVEALPRNASGKVLRRELRKPYWEGQDRMVS